jgi:hypothetical protein
MISCSKRTAAQQNQRTASISSKDAVQLGCVTDGSENKHLSGDCGVFSFLFLLTCLITACNVAKSTTGSVARVLPPISLAIANSVLAEAAASAPYGHRLSASGSVSPY